MAAMEFMCSPENDDDDDDGLGGVREGVCVWRALKIEISAAKEGEWERIMSRKMAETFL